MTGPTSSQAVLADHVGHRCYLADPRHLRCSECDVTLVLTPAGPVLPRNTPQCPAHIGEPADLCGRCRADQLERPTAPAPHAPVASPEAIARAKRHVADALNRRKDTT